MTALPGFDLGGVFATDDTKKTDFLALVETLLASLDKLADFKAKLNAEATAAATTIQDENPVIAASINAALATFNADFCGRRKN